MIELHPEGAGSPILGDWKESSTLYLVGGGKGYRFCPGIQSGDMPLAVVCREVGGVTIAPVHPLCHVGTAGQTATKLSSDETIQLGSDKFRIVATETPHMRSNVRKYLGLTMAIVLALFVGWWLHDWLLPHTTAMVTTDIYSF